MNESVHQRAAMTVCEKARKTLTVWNDRQAQRLNDNMVRGWRVRLKEINGWMLD